VSKRTELVQAIQKAGTFQEQARLVAALDTYDRMQREAAAEERAWGTAGAIVEQTLTPVSVHEHHTAATDWLGEMQTSATGYHQEVCAQAGAWYDRVDPMVKADREEFAQQALGMARRTAGVYGEQAQAAAQTFLDYVALLNKDAASGLPQVDQIRDPKDNPSETPLPLEVFDTFGPPVHPINEGVDGTEDSYRAPLMQEIEQKGNGMGTPEKPGGHSTSMDESGSYAEVPLGPPGQIPTTASYHDGPSVAIGYAMTMDDYRAQQAAEAEQRSRLGFNQAMKKGAPFAGYKDFEACVAANRDKDDPEAYCGKIKHQVEDGKKEGASQLDQVQQRVDSFENPKPTGLPQDVMFPLNPAFQGEENTEELPHAENVAQAKRRAYVAQLLAKSPTEWSENDRREVHAYLTVSAGLTKQADEFSQPVHGPGDEVPVSNSADTTPHPAGGSYDKGKADGQADRASGERPTFSDASSAATDYVKGYSEGYSGGQETPVDNPDVPMSMGGDNGQADLDGEARNTAQVAMASKTAVKKLALKTSARFVTDQAVSDPDFVKGYGWASKWNAKSSMVREGSQAFEAGVYAGITDNPAQQKAWVAAHREAAKKHQAPELMRRISLHEKVTRRFAQLHDEALIRGFYLHAATSTDLVTTGPGTSPDPMGGTPINGPGTPPPMEGGIDPNRPGGPAMYNGAPPYGGGPVAPDPVVGQQQSSTPPVTDTNNPQDAQMRQAAFRQLVQDNLTALTSGGAK
jgi:hypothetical protein